MAQTVYHVVPSGDEWAVKKQGSDQASRVADSQKEAIEHAEQFARHQAPSRIVIHGEDGAIEEQRSFDVGAAKSGGVSSLLTSGPVLTGLALALGVTGVVWFLSQRE